MKKIKTKKLKKMLKEFSEDSQLIVFTDETLNDLIDVVERYEAIAKETNNYFHDVHVSAGQVIKEIERIIENGNDD